MCFSWRCGCFAIFVQCKNALNKLSINRPALFKTPCGHKLLESVLQVSSKWKQGKSQDRACYKIIFLPKQHVWTLLSGVIGELVIAQGSLRQEERCWGGCQAGFWRWCKGRKKVGSSTSLLFGWATIACRHRQAGGWGLNTCNPLSFPSCQMLPVCQSLWCLWDTHNVSFGVSAVTRWLQQYRSPKATLVFQREPESSRKEAWQLMSQRSCISELFAWQC